MKKIVVLDGFAANPGDIGWDGLEKLGQLTVYDRTAAGEILPRIGDAEMVLTNKVPISAETMDACPGMKYIGVLATGYNIVDVAAARERGIVVTNIPAYSTDSVAQMVFALLLEVCHRVGHHNQAIQEGRWSTGKDFCFWDYPLIELRGKTMGIIGYGQIGRAVAQIARAFGMTVIAWGPRCKEDCCVPLTELYARSDVISLHCPLFPENAGMIGREALAQMKDGVILINTARGGLIDEMALREALLSGKVYAAAADVVSVEPIQPDSPLLGLDNMLLTPHIAWAPKEARVRLMNIAVQNAAAYLQGAPINNVAR